MSIDIEIWKEIDGYNGLYQISNFGNVKSFNRKGGGLLKQWLCGKRINNKYLIVYLQHNNEKRKIFKVHRLVGIYFVANPHNKKIANHIDGNKTNNHYKNIDWKSPSENTQHAYDIGLIVRPNCENHCRAKLTNQQAVEIRTLFSSGDYTKKSLAVKFSISERHVKTIIDNIVFKNAA